MLKKLKNRIGAICGEDIYPILKSKTIQEDSDISNQDNIIGITNKSNKKELYITDKIKRITMSDIKNWIPKRSIDGYTMFESREEARDFGSKLYGDWSCKLVCTYIKKEMLNCEDNELNPYKALKNYAGSVFGPLNAYLRFDANKSIAYRLNDTIENIDIAFSDVPVLNENIIVFRRIRLHGDFKNYYQSLEEGDVIQDKAYMSTSLILDVATSHGGSFKDENALLVIKIPKGEKCVFIDEVDGYSEYEMLINKNRNLKVDKILVKNDEQLVLLCELQKEVKTFFID